MLDLKELAKNYDAWVARLSDRGGALDFGPFKALFEERKKLNVIVKIFGRSTPMELSYTQVEKES